MSSAKTAGCFSLILLVFVMLAGCQLHSQESARLHAERSFVVHLEAPLEQVFPLFGPIGEREWVPDWSPRMIFPADGSFPAQGAVFTISSKHSDEIWVLTAYDAQQGLVSYLVVLPGHLVTQIEIRLEKQGDKQSVVEVTYRRTALSAAGDHMVAHFVENASGHAAHWEHAINEALQKRRENAGR